MTDKLSQSKKNSFRRRVIELTITTHLEHFDYYVSKISETFQGEKRTLEDDLDEMSLGLSKEEAAFLEYELGADFYLIDDVFLPLFFYSSTISLCAFFESEFTALCKRLDHAKSQENIWASLNGSGIQKAKKYLRDHACIDFDQLNSYWVELNNMQSIRNCLTHANGNISQMSTESKKDTIRQIASSTNGLSVVGGNKLEISEDYLKERSADVRMFFKRLSEQVYPNEQAAV